MRGLWELLQDAGEGFIADEALSRAASIAYFTLFSIGPLVFIATGLAGVIFGHEQVDAAMLDQLRGLLGEQAAVEVRGMAQGALGEARGTVALAIGATTLLLTASGAFGALQSALNAVWKTETPAAGSMRETITRFMRAKASAIGLVATTGFILITSLSISAMIASFGDWLKQTMPGGDVLAIALDLTVSLIVLTLLFSAIYKVLPDRRLAWRDVTLGALVTALLFIAGKTLIAAYVGGSAVAKGFGAAGTLVVVLVWLYYSSVIFLAGAEFTRAFASRHGSRQASPVAAQPTVAAAQDAQRAAGE
ncbi:YihY/virulence factor BrkB family protein [Plastoroseomonas arctica]|uniref:YihY/virulence factor BrkB family protein n=1 Tax=Plastoroseomonas arctica TaxID=1509237 RepID=A0AAF1KK21_9PROT|nr:YihY/virulence factor BrkB family protein [Plastoroseomonas arctica]MBR0656220.1 YihY/virulence factor BrkB family protein [Plastoroseomonas arctica]